jgi:hypothetical protein
VATSVRSPAPTRLPPRPRAALDPDHIPFYRQLYEATALWAHTWLYDECHPDPLAYLHQHGLSDATIGRYVLGVTLGDAESLVAYLRETCPEAFPYAEVAGLMITDEDGQQRTHWNLRGRLVFPYIAGGEVVDLRTRTYDAGKGYRSLGPYDERGATSPFGWDSVTQGTKTVVVTEAEFKALAALQAYHEGALSYPTLGQPGLTVFRASWAEQLAAQGVEEVVLCYDSQPRPVKDGIAALAPEEQWSLRHGLACAAAGLRVRVARLPLAPGETKEALLDVVRLLFPEADSEGELAYRLWRRGLELTLAEVAGLGVTMPPGTTEEQLAALVAQRLLLSVPLLKRIGMLPLLGLEPPPIPATLRPPSGESADIDTAVAATIAGMGGGDFL